MSQRPCRAAWILPKGHPTLPKALNALDVEVYRVDVLSPDDYSEAEAAVFPPDPVARYGLASHAVVWYEGLCATDGQRQIAVTSAEIKT